MADRNVTILSKYNASFFLNGEQEKREKLHDVPSSFFRSLESFCVFDIIKTFPFSDELYVWKESILELHH